MRTKKTKHQEAKSCKDNGTPSKDLGYLVFFSDAFIACVPWYQSTRRPTKRPKKKHALAMNNKKTNKKINSTKKKGILLQMDILGLTRWPNWGRVSRSRIGSARTTTVKRGARVMLRRHVSGRSAEGKLGVETRGPAIAVAALVAV